MICYFSNFCIDCRSTILLWSNQLRWHCYSCIHKWNNRKPKRCYANPSEPSASGFITKLHKIFSWQLIPELERLCLLWLSFLLVPDFFWLHTAWPVSFFSLWSFMGFNWVSVEDDSCLCLTIYARSFVVEFLDKKFMGNCTCWSWGQISKHASTLACIWKSLWVFYFHIRCWASIHNREKPEGIVTFIICLKCCINVDS